MMLEWDFDRMEADNVSEERKENKIEVLSVQEYLDKRKGKRESIDQN